jgi:uncharacterized tellurite resistance protein B-like protein
MKSEEARMTKVTFEADLLPHLTDILMAGAHADEQLDGREVDAVEKLLVSLIKDADSLPESLRTRIDAFDPEQFDAKRTAYAMGDLTAEQRRAVLEMLSDLSEADEEIDLKEDEFLRKVAEALGSTPEELEGLTVEVELISTPSRRAPPPPPPPRSKA